MACFEHCRTLFRVPSYLLRLLDNYLRDRTLSYNVKGGTWRLVVISGAAQGSIIGHDLCIVAYDILVRVAKPDETFLIGYAEDVAALIAARTVETAQFIRTANAWMEDHGLSLALSKTEITMLTKK